MLVQFYHIFMIADMSSGQFGAYWTQQSKECDALLVMIDGSIVDEKEPGSVRVLLQHLLRCPFGFMFQDVFNTDRFLRSCLLWRRCCA